jgi:hypothetical protein
MSCHFRFGYGVASHQFIAWVAKSFAMAAHRNERADALRIDDPEQRQRFLEIGEERFLTGGR